MIDVRASNKRLLLQELAAKAASSLVLGVDQVAPYLLKREELGSTGIGGGVAIPHARLPDLERPYGLLAKLKQPVECNRWARGGYRIYFFIAGSCGERTTRSARRVARTLRPPENLVRLRRAKDASELYSAIV
jgi:PTS system nitrogen regulatory IIA component